MAGGWIRHFLSSPDWQDTCFEAIMAGKIQKGDVVVIRYEGPRGSPGMPEAPPRACGELQQPGQGEEASNPPKAASFKKSGMRSWVPWGPV